MRYPTALSVVCVLLSIAVSQAAAQQAQKPFRLQEATIANVHAAFAADQLTCRQLAKLYLDRIAAYDQQGPTLRAIISVNPIVRETAAELDRKYRENRSSVGSLHCIPVVLKDNFNTADMPTTGGNVSMKKSVPQADAFTVAKMRNAGALILGKTNLSEFARDGMSN